jgi:hypothetical protein
MGTMLMLGQHVIFSTAILLTGNIFIVDVKKTTYHHHVYRKVCSLISIAVTSGPGMKMGIDKAGTRD